MEEVTIFSFDNKDYMLLDQIHDYVYLSNVDDRRDMMIRKEDENDKELLLPLEDDEEFEQALLLLVNQTLEQEEVD